MSNASRIDMPRIRITRTVDAWEAEIRAAAHAENDPLLERCARIMLAKAVTNTLDNEAQAAVNIFNDAVKKERNK